MGTFIRIEMYVNFSSYCLCKEKEPWYIGHQLTTEEALPHNIGKTGELKFACNNRAEENTYTEKKGTGEELLAVLRGSLSFFLC